MQTIYDSPNYCVVEFAADAQSGGVGGFEIMDKAQRREIFIDGALAARFREHVAALAARAPGVDEIDAFLSRFDGLMQQPVNLH